jgi:murein hydrolase activator
MSARLSDMAPFVKAALMRVTAVFMILILSGHASAQSKKELEKKKQQLQKDIEYTNQLLNQTKKNKSSSLTQLVTLNKKITYRNELITTINTEINVVEKEIGYVSSNIDSLNETLAEMKKRYADLLYHVYKNESAYSRIMFIFSAGDFNQAFKRMQYLRQLS